MLVFLLPRHQPLMLPSLLVILTVILKYIKCTLCVSFQNERALYVFLILLAPRLCDTVATTLTLHLCLPFRLLLASRKQRWQF